jgi:uncharacterized protein (TIGR02246 family)
MMINSGSVEDRLAIRELVESYNDAVMRVDVDAWGANWADDATWSLPGLGAVTGRAAIVAAWTRAMSAFEFVGFFASAGPITVNGDRARGMWYQQEFLRGKDGSRRNVTGRYTDEYVKREGRWLFQTRTYEVLRTE